MRVALRPLALLLSLLLPARELPGQQPPPAAGVVMGTVHDSLAGRPLPGAIVQLAPAGDAAGVVRSAQTGSDGRFTITGVGPGRFLLGFLHPVLDTLGIEAPLRAVELREGDTVRVHLAVPPARAVRLALCGGARAGGPPGGGEPPGAVTGVVRDARDRAPVAGAVVQSTWAEYDIAPGTVSRRRAGAADTSGVDGRFALCDVPRGGALAVRAWRGGDSTAIVELEVPAGGLLRRDLFLGSARRTVARIDDGAPDAPPRAAGAGGDSVAILAGDGRLQGRVRTADGGRPIEGAVVGIDQGPATRTSARGEWSLAGLPTGTRTLQVRRVGFYPVRLAVDVAEGAPFVDVALPEFQAVLDTVRVKASRWRLQDTGFEERRRSGTGRYLTTADLLQVPVIFTSDVFLRVPGVQVDRTMMGGKRLSVRGPFGRCAPQVYIDGLRMQNLGADDIDAFVSPDEVAGIEVYSGAFVPAQFQEGLAGCGSIVIWTKQGENPARRWSARRRALHGTAAVLLGAGIGILFARH